MMGTGRRIERSTSCRRLRLPRNIRQSRRQGAVDNSPMQKWLAEEVTVVRNMLSLVLI